MKLDDATAQRTRGVATADLGVQELRSQAEAVRSERELALRKVRQQIDNDVSDGQLRAHLIAKLPEVAQALPQPEELRAVTISSDGTGGPGALAGFLASMYHLVQDALKRPEKSNGAKDPA
jgi:hypothetical protein